MVVSERETDVLVNLLYLVDMWFQSAVCGDEAVHAEVC